MTIQEIIQRVEEIKELAQSDPEAAQSKERQLYHEFAMWVSSSDNPALVKVQADVLVTLLNKIVWRFRT